MTFEFQIDAGDWELDRSLMQELQVVGQDAMAIRFSDIVLQNFGQTGLDRPTQWKPLHPLYAIAKHGGDTTPTLVLSGELRKSIDVELGGLEYASVFTDCPYASDHQWGADYGNRTLPARPFFPITDSGELTPYAEFQVVEAAEKAIADKLSS